MTEKVTKEWLRGEIAVLERRYRWHSQRYLQTSSYGGRLIDIYKLALRALDHDGVPPPKCSCAACAALRRNQPRTSPITDEMVVALLSKATAGGVGGGAPEHYGFTRNDIIRAAEAVLPLILREIARPLLLEAFDYGVKWESEGNHGISGDRFVSADAIIEWEIAKL